MGDKDIFYTRMHYVYRKKVSFKRVSNSKPCDHESDVLPKIETVIQECPRVYNGVYE